MGHRGGRYFSSNRAGCQVIYSSIDFGPAQLVPELNTTLNDVRPNVRKDGLEIVFDSNRPGTFGLLDIYTASRATTTDQWSTATNLGSLINSTGNDARPTLSRDGLTLLFGSNRAGGDGQSDIYISRRENRTGNDQ